MPIFGVAAILAGGRRDPYAKGTWTAYCPGQLSGASGSLGQPEGLVFFAGSDVARGWAGFIDGAIESGKLAAGQVAARLGIPERR
jgi:monoamine oxidase